MNVSIFSRLIFTVAHFNALCAHKPFNRAGGNQNRTTPLPVSEEGSIDISLPTPTHREQSGSNHHGHGAGLGYWRIKFECQVFRKRSDAGGTVEIVNVILRG